MLSSHILDIVIGITFIFLLYSLLVTTVQEGIASLLNLRARKLRSGIKQMLTNTNFLDLFGFLEAKFFPNLRDDRDPGLWKRFYDHPIIKNYGEGNYIWKYPSYLSPQNFSTILLDVLKSNLPMEVYKAAATEELKKEMVAGGTTDPKPTADQITERANKILNAQNDVQKLETLIQYSKTNEDIVPKETTQILDLLLSNAKKETAKWADDDYAKQLASVSSGIVAIRATDLQIQGKTIELLRTSLDKWFDDTMVRVSGWYKRQTQLILLLLGFAVAIVLNVDTIDIVNKLSVDKDARKQIVDMATAYVGTHKEAGPSFVINTSTLSGKNLPTSGTNPDTATAFQKRNDSLINYVQNLLKNNIDSANNILAIGYDGFGLNDDYFVRTKLMKDATYKHEIKKYEDTAEARIDRLWRATKNTIETESALRTRLDTPGNFSKYYSTIKQNQSTYKKNISKIWDRLALIKDPLDTGITFEKSITALNKHLDLTMQIGFRPILDPTTKKFDSMVIANVHDTSLLKEYIKNTAPSEALMMYQAKFFKNKIAEGDSQLQMISRFNLMTVISDSSKDHKIRDTAIAKFNSHIDSLQSYANILIENRSHYVHKNALKLLYSENPFWIHVKYILFSLFARNKIIGFLITAFAISLGSPFWFDLLNKFMKLRSATKQESN